MTETADDLARSAGQHRSDLLARLRATRDARSDHDGPRRVERPARIPLSPVQEPLWFLDRLAPGGSTYNVPLVWRLSGPLDVAAWRGALAAMVARQESLRTSFAEHDGEAVQQIHDAGGDFELATPKALGDTAAERLAAARDIAEQLAGEPFDLTAPPLWRAALIDIDAEDHLFVFVAHHAVCDGWSTSIVAAEFAAAYRQTALPPLEIQYADYALWQRGLAESGAFDADLDFWRGQLAGVPLTEMPADRPRPAFMTHAGATLRKTIRTDGVAAAARAAGVTPYTVYLAAYAVLLHRHTGQDEVVLGTVTANRSRVEAEGLIGHFVNMLAIRTDLTGDPDGREVLARTETAVRSALSHSAVPFEKVVEAVAPPRDPARSPLFQVSFGLLAAPTPPELAGITASVEPIGLSTSRFDLSFNVVEGAQQTLVEAEYRTDLFDAVTIEALVGQYERVLSTLIAEPGTVSSRIPLLGTAERTELVCLGSGPVAPMPTATIPEIFRAVVDKTPDAVAVLSRGESFTYEWLDRRSDQIAAVLRQHGAARGERVALLLPRDQDLVAAVLAVVKTGAAYVPIDAAYPPARTAVILDDARPVAVLTAASLSDRLPTERSSVIVLDEPNALDDPNVDNPEPQGPTPHDTAYVIYTSGTTGKPKGVPIGHRSVTGFVAAVTELFELTAADHVLGFAALNFDVSVFETFSALLNGATLCLADDDERIDPGRLQRLLQEAAVTVTDLPPTVMALLDPAPLTALRIVFVGGEAFSAELVNRWNPGRRLFNGYGPTECTVTMTVQECPGTWSSTPPIGLPMANHVAHVLDRHAEPAPFGVPGELVIGGVGLAAGYLNAPELTAEKFLDDPFGTAPGARLYRTGDLVKRQRPDGALVFLGRIDQQVKIRGLRIELGEIETVLAAHPGVGQAAARPWTDEHGEPHLVAYVSGAGPGGVPDPARLRAHLAEHLPRYMVPAFIVVLDELPLTVSGKVDARMLPGPEDSSRVRSGGTAPSTETERVLAREIVGPLLGTEDVGVHDDFFELGGNSLQATRLVSRIRDRFAVEVALADFFRSPTVAALAAAVDRTLAGSLTDAELLALIESLPAGVADQLLDAEAAEAAETAEDNQDNH